MGTKLPSEPNQALRQRRSGPVLTDAPHVCGSLLGVGVGGKKKRRRCSQFRRPLPSLHTFLCLLAGWWLLLMLGFADVLFLMRFS